MNLNTCLITAIRKGNIAVVKYIWNIGQSVFRDDIHYIKYAIFSRSPQMFDFIISRVKSKGHRFKLFEFSCERNNSYAADYFAKKVIFQDESTFIKNLWNNKYLDIEPYFYESIPLYFKLENAGKFLNAAILRRQCDFVKVQNGLIL